jgi:hypothetical protein
LRQFALEDISKQPTNNHRHRLRQRFFMRRRESGCDMVKSLAPTGWLPLRFHARNRTSGANTKNER